MDTCQLKTILHAESPRTNCSEHGPSVVKLPWAEPGSRFTLLFEALAIRWLLQTSKSGMLGTMNLSWDEAHQIQARAVARGMERRKAEIVRHIGADEKSYKKRHKYLTLANDLVRGRVLFVAEGRSKASLDAFWPTLTKEQIEGIHSASIDMCDPYVASIKEHVRDGARKIVYDKFHIAAHLCEAVDAVRRRENKLKGRAGHRLVCIQVKGRSMRSAIAEQSVAEGGLSFVDQDDRPTKESPPSPESMYAVRVEGDEVVLKRLALIDHVMILISANPDVRTFPPRSIDLRKSPAPVIGKIVWKWEECP